MSTNKFNILLEKLRIASSGVSIELRRQIVHSKLHCTYVPVELMIDLKDVRLDSPRSGGGDSAGGGGLAHYRLIRSRMIESM